MYIKITAIAYYPITLLHSPFLQPVAQGPLPQLICSVGIVVELQKLLDTV